MSGFMNWLAGHWSQIWTVIALFVGAGLVMATEALRDRRAVWKDDRAALRDRERTITDRREAFELQHLIDLNAILGELCIVVTRIVWGDIAHARVNKEPYKPTFNDGALHQRCTELVAEYGRLRGLVLDDSLREMVMKAARLLVEPITIMENEARVREALDAATKAGQEVQDAIAGRVRAIYATGSQRAGAVIGLSRFQRG